MKFTNTSRHKTFVNAKAGEGLVQVDPGEEVEVEGERRIELATENARLEQVDGPKTKSKSAKAAEKKASRKAPAKKPARKRSSKRKAPAKKTGTVTSDQVPKP